MSSAEDSQWMSLALQLAEKGLYTTSPNPRVGCVITKNNRLIGQGWHQRAGEAHAEIHALKQAGSAAQGATAYVTLEPCAHFGRTPPCCQALIHAGIKRVVVAMQDPNPLVAGRGLQQLQQAGIATEHGLMQAAAEALNPGFIQRMRHQRPWIRSKIGCSLDGKTALNNGISQWITSPQARQDVQHWRARSCAIVTGINTILADNAQLNVRTIDTPRQPASIILDSQLRIPTDAKVLNNPDVIIYSCNQHTPEKQQQLQQQGARIRFIDSDSQNRINLAAAFKDMAQLGFNEILVEAGQTLNGALLEQQLIDQLIIYLAPQLLGNQARGLAQLSELSQLEQRINLQWDDIRQLGPDLRITTHPTPSQGA